MISVHVSPRVVAAMHAAVVLLVHPVAVGRRADELVHAEADLLVLARPLGAQASVAGRPGVAAVAGLEHADPLHDRPEARVVVGVQHQRREAEVAGRLVRRVVPPSLPGLAGERRELRPVRAVVAALEDAGRLDADEHAARRRRESRGLRDLPPRLVVGEALARERPGLAEVAAPPDGRAVPFARRGRVDRARRRLEHGVVDGPGLAVRAAQLPVAAVGVAFEQE